MRQAEVRRCGEMIVFDFEAGAFLHHMVRNLVGSLVYIGQNKHPPEWMGQLLECRDRRQAAPTFSAAGLYLVGVNYEPHWGLPSRDDVNIPGLTGQQKRGIRLMKPRIKICGLTREEDAGRRRGRRRRDRPGLLSAEPALCLCANRGRTDARGPLS